MAAYYGQVSVIEYLATNQIKSANVNLKSSKGGLTPLHFAVRGCLKRWKNRKPLSQRNPNFKETIDMFIALGADSTIKNDKKQTAKQYAEYRLEQALKDPLSKNYDYSYFTEEFDKCEECLAKKKEKGLKHWFHMKDLTPSDTDEILNKCWECSDLPCHPNFP